MTPAEIIRPYAQAADRERPELKEINTKPTCFALLAATLKKAGPDFAFIGKTANMDGEGKYTPPGFVPFEVNLPREDGQLQKVQIVAVSMDACWHLPTVKQVKVIVNSTDGEPGGSGKPARLDCYNIEEYDTNGHRQYRWHNPPVRQSVLGITPDTPAPAPPPAPPVPQQPNVLPKGDAFVALKALDAFYRADDGLKRPEGIGGDMEAIAQWFYQLVIERKTIEDVKAQIRNSEEWKGKHP